jgi:hypothetical protein
MNNNNSSFQLQLQEEGYGQSQSGDISRLPLASNFWSRSMASRKL